MPFKGAKGSVTIIDRATKPLQSIANAFSKLGNSSKKTNKDLSSTQKAIKGISKAQNRLNRVNANIKRNTRDIGSQAVGVAALALSFKAALNPAIKFEQSMKDLQSVAFGAADSTVPVAKNMALLSEQAKQLGATTAHSATQAAEGQIFLAKAGFKTNQILKTMPSLLSLASASGTDLGRTSDILSDLLGAFGKQAKDSGALADVLAAATSSANVDMESLFETLKVAAPIGVAAGQSMEGITTATALLGNVGIKGSMAGTALKNAFVNLASPAAKGAKVLEELGIKTADSAGNMLPLEDIMLSLGKKAKDLSQVKRVKAFDAVFGKIAMAGAINLEKAVTSGDFDKMLKNLQNSEGVADKMAKIRMDSTEGSIVQLMSAVEGIAIAFGSILTPILRTAAETINSITPSIQSFIKHNEPLIKGVGAVAAVLLAGKIAILGYTAAMWLVSPAITALTAVLTFIKAPLATMNLLMNTNPIGLLIAGFAALVVAGVYLYETFQPVRDFLDGFNDVLQTIFNSVMDVIDAFSNLKIPDLKMPSIPSFGEIGSSISDTAGGAFDSVSSFFGGSPEQATQAINANSTTNVPVAVSVNIVDNKVQGVESSGGTKTDVFLNNGSQF